jgi:hypothetical protein
MAHLAMPMKERFRDSHERRAYLRSVLVAERLLENPELVGQAKRYLDRFVRRDPRQASAYALWRKLLEQPAEEIALRLVADSPEGAVLRDSAPVFTVITPAEFRAALTR